MRAWMVRACGLALAMVAAVGCSGDDDDDSTAPTTTAEPCRLEQPVGRFLFTDAGVGGNFDVFTLLPGMEEAVNLTHDPGGELKASWTADGLHIAFETDRDAGNHEIYLMDGDGSDLTNLTRSPADDRHVAWSPDGRYIAYSSDRPGGWGVWVVDVETGKHRLVAPRGLLPIWSPDSRRIAYSEEEPANDELAVVNVDGTGKLRLTDERGNDLSPAWSPDGKHIAFESNRDGNSEIYRIDPDGTHLRRLTDDPLEDQFPTWSPDSTQVLYQHHGQVRIMKADGTCGTDVTGPLATGQFVSWHD